nr:putative ribonuclease H-like domain-containing protein [Tanacetum cinerariifolium]
MGLWYPKGSSFDLTAFLDADHAGCINSRKTTSGGIQFPGDKLVSWMSKKQNYTTMSSAEAEYSAIAISCNPVQHSRTKHIHTRYHFIKEQVENGIIEFYFVKTEYQLADMFTKALPEDRFKYLIRVNAASAPVTIVGPNPTNSTNGFNAASPFDNVVSLNFEIGGKSSFVDPSQYPDDPDMPALEDIIYSNNKDDVVARIEAIRLFLAYASFMGLMVYKMDVKSAFLYGTIKEEMYVCQPPGFEDPDYLDKVYKVVKALYGLNQAPRTWYKTLANYLFENGFQRGKIDQNLFIKKQKGDILHVHVYVDDIIFGSTNKELLKQKDDGIFISQDKYITEILRKFSLIDGKSASTPIDTEKPLLKDPDDEDVDVHIYRSMIGSLMYITLSRPYIMFAVCACARFQVTPKASHLHAVKRIFRYLKCKPHLGLWYPKDSPFNLVAYSDSDYAGASLDRKYTTGGCQFLGCRLISWQCKKQTVVAISLTKAEYVADASCCAQEQPTHTSESSMTLLNTLIETCATLTQKVAHLEQDKVSQALEITKLKKRVKKLERKRRLKHSGLKRRMHPNKGKIAELDADEDVTLVDVDTAVEMDADIQGRMQEDVTDVKEINAVEPEPTVFDDEEVICIISRRVL